MHHSHIVQQPTIAIVGRANVGKSTLFNRLIEESRALVSRTPGTTRSPNYGDAIWRGRVFHVVDTGGLEKKRSKDPFSEEISRYAHSAIENAALVLFLVDLQVGITPLDRELAKQFAKMKKPVLLAGNKMEGKDARNRIHGSWDALGFGTLHPISAVTGVGVGDLLDESFDILKNLKQLPPTIEEAFQPTKIAIIGKPNVGKSLLLNALVGKERALVSEIAHTTREPQDTLVRYDDELFLFTDTAGIRKKMKLGKGLESAGVQKTIQILDRIDVILFILDITQPPESQDRHLAGLATKSGAGVIMVANKWDLMEDKQSNTPNTTRAMLTASFPFFTWAPVLFVSAKTGSHVSELFTLIRKVAKNRTRIIPENELSQFLKQATTTHRPSRGKGMKHPHIYKMQQVADSPPMFELSIRGGRESVHPSYFRFLENQIRKHFDFSGTPITIQGKVIHRT